MTRPPAGEPAAPLDGSNGRCPSGWPSANGRGPLFVSTASTSADIFLAPVLAELRRRNSLGTVAGLGGAPLREEGVELFFDTTDVSSVGLAASVATFLAHASGAVRTYRRTARYFREAKPALVILVDNPGHNLRLLALAHAHAIPVLYYIPPETWGVTRWQIRAIAARATVILSVLSREGDAYAARGGNVRWVGHPALDLARMTAGRPEPDGQGPRIGLFPGSRRQELVSMLPILREAVEIIREAEPRAHFMTCSANDLAAKLIHEALKGWSVPVEVAHRQPQSVLSRCDVLLTCSGTATLEAAILGVPMVVMYRLGWVDRIIQGLLVRYPYFALPNYLLNCAVVPELGGERANPRRVAAEALALLRNPRRRQEVLAGLGEVRHRLGPPGAVGRVADVVEELLSAPDARGHSR